ncbi:PREDICTED: CMRF35-like molecule 9 isoform X2 [Bison bison bison]|uniref:CMRF35-like molecule 9 isoform X2 n=1 Tax=Bison bison bison TaxID=43346 RepID=A0A6P3GVT3_BISBB|nr:PREDICTED: CMRF35-like molecule 9 isoform X2 [Bison bison bison]
MRPLLMLWGCLVLPGYGSVVNPKEISGFEGDTVSLQCTYEEELKKHQKYWCREAGLFISRCTGTVFSGEYGQEGRVSVHDNPRENRFTVILRNLTLKDMGKYWCGVKRLGFDKTMSVSLLVFPVTTAKLGKTEAEASPFTGTSLSKHTAASPYAGTSLHPATSPFARISPHPATSPYAGTSLHPAVSPFARISPHPATSPYAGTSLHPATSPPAGISQPATQLDSTSTEDTSFVPSSSSKSRVSIPLIRILAPVLVLLALLLATGLAALGNYMFQRREKAQLASETQKKDKVHLSHLTSEDDEASWQDPKGDMTPASTLPMSGDEPGFSKFSSV